MRRPMPPARAAAAGGGSMVLLLMVALLAFIGWAAVFEIDQTVRAQGQFIPSSRTQVIQAADGGVLAEILAKEGQTVKAGERLAILQPERPNAAYQEGRARAAGLAIALERAQAEASGREPRFGKEFGDFPDIVALQTSLHLQRKRTLDQDLASLNEALVLTREELRLSESLLKTGDISQMEVMRARRQVSEVQGRINGTRNRFLQEARQEASRLQEELTSNKYKLEERKSVLDHTVLTAPVAGIVKYLRMTTVGGVLRAGDEFMQISPADGGLMIEAKINPADIGQLSTGLPVGIKMDAFDYSVYGTLKGKLTYLSSDTLSEQGGNGQVATYYRAQVVLDRDHTNPKLPVDLIKPGMTASLDIQTNRRSVLAYLLKPVSRAFDGALNER